MNLITYISSVIQAGKRIINFNGFGRYDPRTAIEIAPFGVDGNPAKACRCAYSETSNINQRIVFGYENTRQLAQPGELRLYSTDTNATLKTYIWLHADGTMEMGGNANHMTQFEGLQTAFDQLKSDFNALVTLYNTHVHSGGTISGSTGPTPTPGSSSAADITPAKITEIKTL